MWVPPGKYNWMVHAHCSAMTWAVSSITAATCKQLVDMAVTKFCRDLLAKPVVHVGWLVGDLGSRRNFCREIRPRPNLWRGRWAGNREQLSATSDSSLGIRSVDGWRQAAKVAPEGYQICSLIMSCFLIYYICFCFFSFYFAVVGEPT